MIEVKPIPEEKLVEIVKRARQAEKEAEFILTVETVSEKSGVSVWNKWYEVILGNVQEVLIDYEDRGSGSDYKEWSNIAIIPLTVPVVIRVIEEYDGWDERSSSETIYVFTSSGWKSVEV